MTSKIGRLNILFSLLLGLTLLACGPGDTEAPGDKRAAPTYIGGKADLPSWLVDSGKSLSCTARTSGAFSGYDSAHLFGLSAATVDTDYALTFSGTHAASAGVALAVFQAATGKLVTTERVTQGNDVSVKFKGKAGQAFKVGAFSVEWQATGSYRLALACKNQKPAKPTTPATPSSGFKVAAVQYGSGQAASASASCASAATPNICALSALTSQAAASGAKLVVLPEYALGGDQKYYETPPTVGTTPTATGGGIVGTFSALARKHQVYLTFDLATASGSKSAGYKYQNTVVAFDPTGKVVAVHHKFNLFGSETKRLTAGNSVTTFNTPAGKVGLLICADIYGSSTLLSRLAKDLGARVVAISSFWTVSGSTNWYKKYTAKYGVYAVVGNTTHSPGQGGGVYDPKGKAMAEKISTSPSVVIATIP
jgi:predicted amidohydrolase